MAGTGSSGSHSELHQGCQVPVTDWQDLQRPAFVFGTADDILNVGYDADGRDHTEPWDE